MMFLLVQVRLLFIYLLVGTVQCVDRVDVVEETTKTTTTSSLLLTDDGKVQQDEQKQHQQPTFDDPYDEANWYISIASEQFAAGESVLSQFIVTQEEQEEEDGSSNDDTYKREDYEKAYKVHIDKSISSYQQAINVYNDILRKALIARIDSNRRRTSQQGDENSKNLQNPEEGNEVVINLDIWTANFYLANTYYSIGEVYYILLTSPLVLALKSPEQTSNKENEKLALKYYQKSYDKLSILLRQLERAVNDKRRSEQNLDFDGTYDYDNDIALVSETETITEAELLLAHCSMRIGSILLNNQQVGSTASSSKHSLHQQQQLQQNEDLLSKSLANMVGKASVTDLLLYLTDPSKLEQMINDGMNKILSELEQQQRKATEPSIDKGIAESITKAKKYYDDAERLFRKLLDTDIDDNNNNKDYLKRHLATSLYSGAVIAVYENDFSSASFYYEESIELNEATIDYEEHVLADDSHYGTNNKVQSIYSAFDPAVGDHDAVIVNCRTSILDALYALSDVYLRQGKFDIAKDRYRHAMAYIEDYNLPLQAFHELLDAQFIELDDDKKLKEYLLKLEDYDSKFGRGTAVGGSGDPMSERDQHFFDQPIVDDSYYAENADQAKDGSYEGDLHATLGSMYMAKQDFVAALSHFNQAIRLYELAGEHHSVVMANTKFNLATLNFRIGEYSTSADEYDEALDIFKQVYGDGTNPFSLLAQWKGIIDGFGTVVDGMDVFNNVLYGAYDQYAVGSSTFSSSTESNNQQLVDEQNTEPVDSISKELEDSDTMETIETIESTSSSFSTDDRKNNNIHGTNVATKQNVKIVLPGGSSVDLSKFLQQNKSTQDEL